MNTPSLGWRHGAAFAAGALANVFVLYRFLTYAERNRLPASTYLLFAGICFLIGFGVTIGVTNSRVRIATLVLAGVTVAQIVVIGFDWRRDPTDHNMFPFELAMLCFAAAPAYIGAACSRFLATASKQ